MANKPSVRFEDAFRNLQVQSKASSSRSTTQPQSQAASGASDRKILIAVDFGTTYSAAAWVQTRLNNTQRPTINIIDTWPPHSDTRDKVPTVLQYLDDEIRWGFDYDEGEDRFQWFKLEQDPKYKGAALKRAVPPHTREPTNDDQVKLLITEYLKLFRDHVEKSIKESMDLGGGLQDFLLKDTQWEYIITVPALWPESAQNITKKCAKDAGMTPLQVIAEPEAAGIYALDHMNQELDLKVGDTFVICDAGGGTVDLISYTVTKLIPSTKIPSLELDEAAAGTGGLCGSSFLDREFHRWLTEHVSDCRGWSQNHTADAMIKWETELKRNYTGDPSADRKYVIPARRIEDDRTLNIKKDHLEVSASRMKKIFEPVISQIVALVHGQVTEVKKSGKAVKAVLLAGGFGRNEYLRTRIQTEVGTRVKVKKMKDCTTAIVRGALIRGLANRLGQSPTAGQPTIAVASRLARKHYGTQALQKFAPDFHDHSQPRKPGGVDGGERIDVMLWFVEKNSRVKDFQPQAFDFYYDQSVVDADYNGRFDTLTLPIYTSEQDKAPKYPSSAQVKTTPYRKLVDLKADLNKIPRSKLKQEKGEDGRMYYKIGFQIVMTCHLANVKFKLVHEKEQYGEVVAVWDTS